MKLLISILADKCRYFFMYIVNHLFHDKKRVFFYGMGGGYNDNARAVSEALHKTHPEYRIYWHLADKMTKDTHVPDYVKKVTSNIGKHFQLASASVWCLCSQVANSCYKSKGQLYIQLWHGDRGFKKILRDSGDVQLLESRHCDYMTSGSLFYDSIVKTAFGYDKSIIVDGCPRNDKLFNLNAAQILSIKKELSVDDQTKLLLYAPTFRDESLDNQVENIDIDATLSCLEEATKSKWLCLGRFHPRTQGRSKFKSAKIVDVTSYFDMSDLLCISDALITDYSSAAGDFVLMNKPVLLFQPDRLEYSSHERQFYFDIDQSPFWCAKSQSELNMLIRALTPENIVENCREISAFYGIHETGKASEEVVALISQFIENTDGK